MSRTDRCMEAFHAEYARSFPAGGDAQDHDEATRSGIDAVLGLVAADLHSAVDGFFGGGTIQRDIHLLVDRVLCSESTPE